MNIIFSCYCRIFQTALKIALPFLPYRDPGIIPQIKDIPSVLKEKGLQHPLIVTDRTIRGLGLTEGLTEVLQGENIPYALYDGVVANPTTDNVEEALLLYQKDRCDCLIAFGGGTTNYSLSAASGLFQSVVGTALLILSNSLSRKLSSTSLF